MSSPSFLRAAFLLVGALLLHPLPALHAEDSALGEIRKSLVRVSTTGVVPDYKAPWTAGRTSSGVGAGFVIDGNRIMTNAHVVTNARFVSVQKEGDPNLYVAKVKFIAHDADLAILEVEKPDFFQGTKPLQFGGIPAIESAVSAYGYPIGGDRMSVTRGIVSRIDFQAYSHSGADTHLAVQIDAAINPGNSGGPVLQNGKVVGVAFQGYGGEVAQNTGYMIPTPVIRRFLKDVEDGKYDRYVDTAIGTFNLLNPAQRRSLGLENDNRGVLVTSVYAGGSAEGQIKIGDVLIAIDDYAVSSDGYVEMDGERIEMPEVVERKFLGDKVKVTLFRDRKPIEVTLTLKSAWQLGIQSYNYDSKPRFVLYGGLLFQPLSREFLDAYRPDDLRLRYFYESFVSEQLYVERPEVVVLSGILPDPINTYLTSFTGSIVGEINGHKIRRLEDVASALEEEKEFTVIRVLGDARPIVLDRAKVKEAAPRIQERYRVLSPKNLES